MLPRIQPINPSQMAVAFDDPDWVFELKHDGFRAVGYIEAGACQLVSRKQTCTRSPKPGHIAVFSSVLAGFSHWEPAVL